MIIMSFTPVEATWTDIHQISSSSHTIQMTGDGYYMEPENAYDGIGSQGGDPVLLRTDPCYTQSTPSQGSSIEIDYTLSTNQSSVPFNIEFRLTHVPTNAPDSYVSVSIYNMNTQNYDEITNIGDQSGNDYNISRSSAYMDNAGNIYLKVFTGHGNQDCNSYAEVRFYEFFIHTDIVEEPNFDQDNDGINDSEDSCPNGENTWISNPASDHDSDGCKDDLEDDDDDNDGVLDNDDICAKGDMFSSNSVSDYDNDGCKDDSEDNDDDNDQIPDNSDDCTKGDLGWTSDGLTDYDGDGCLDDSSEDNDDDNDGIIDSVDICQKGLVSWSSTITNDFDSDGCNDQTEDDDDDNDAITDNEDECSLGELNWISDTDSDHDGDGCKDNSTEDLDDDNDNVNDIDDQCSLGELNWVSDFNSDYDGDGCKDDSIEDLDDDNDNVADELDICGKGYIPNLINPETDYDGDGCFAQEDDDDDNDGVLDNDDNCQTGRIAFNGNDRDGDGCQDSDEDEDDDGDGLNDTEDNCDDDSSQLNWSSDPVTDYDSDGCKDTDEDLDDDNDGINDVDNNSQKLDKCPDGELNWNSNDVTDHDSDGCKDNVEDNDNDNDEVKNNVDQCPLGELNWVSDSNSDYDSDGCKDDSVEDNDDDNDNVTDAKDSCPKTVLEVIVDQNGCEISSNTVAETESSEISVTVIGGISLSALILIGLVIYLGGFLTGSIRDDNEIEATSADLIEYIESLENHIASADKSLLAENNTYYREVIAYTYALINKYRGNPKVKILTVEDIMGKMQKYGRCEVSGLVLLRALSTTICRFHVKRLNYNGFEMEAKRVDGRMFTGKQIMKQFSDILTARKGKRMRFKNWIKSTNKEEIFPAYYNMLQQFDEVIHPEDFDKIKSYQDESFAKHCTLIVNYLKILIDHPEYPYPLREEQLKIEQEIQQ